MLSVAYEAELLLMVGTALEARSEHLLSPDHRVGNTGVANRLTSSSRFSGLSGSGATGWGQGTPVLDWQPALGRAGWARADCRGARGSSSFADSRQATQLFSCLIRTMSLA